jgi:hypothetical protein
MNFNNQGIPFYVAGMTPAQIKTAIGLYLPVENSKCSQILKGIAGGFTTVAAAIQEGNLPKDVVDYLLASVYSFKTTTIDPGVAFGWANHTGSGS